MSEFTLMGLQVLREVAARGSFTAAAEALDYTQSAISRQVAGLEAAAGAPLFVRVARGVHLTGAGSALLRRGGNVLDEIDLARQELAMLAEPARARLRVGAFPTAVASLVPQALSAFRERHPGIETPLREGSTPTQLKRLGSGKTDLAVIGVLPDGDRPEDHRLDFDHLADDPLLLAVGRGHPLSGLRSIDMEDLADERWIAATATADDALLGAWQWSDWRPRVEFIAREWTAKMGLVAAGLGVTLVPGLAASGVRSDVALVRIRGDRPASRAVLIATPAGAEPSPLARTFSEALHESVARLTVEVQGRVDDY